MKTKQLLFALLLSAVSASAQRANDRIELGPLENGTIVVFARFSSNDWGVEISGGATRFTQPKPAQIEVYRGQTNVQQLAAGYQSVKKEADAIVATAKVSSDGAAAFEQADSLARPATGTTRPHVAR